MGGRRTRRPPEVSISVAVKEQSSLEAAALIPPGRSSSPPAWPRFHQRLQPQVKFRLNPPSCDRAGLGSDPRSCSGAAARLAAAETLQTASRGSNYLVFGCSRRPADDNTQPPIRSFQQVACHDRCRHYLIELITR